MRSQVAVRIVITLGDEAGVQARLADPRFGAVADVAGQTRDSGTSRPSNGHCLPMWAHEVHRTVVFESTQARRLEGQCAIGPDLSKGVPMSQNSRKNDRQNRLATTRDGSIRRSWSYNGSGATQRARADAARRRRSRSQGSAAGSLSSGNFAEPRQEVSLLTRG
jgi:hypothetical protein